MTTLDNNAPGNYGILDVVKVLEFIQEHIRSFRGDPNQVCTCAHFSVWYTFVKRFQIHVISLQYKYSCEQESSPACPQETYRPPCSLSGGRVVPPVFVQGVPPRGQTDTCENITSRRTSYAGGNNRKSNWTVFNFQVTLVGAGSGAGIVGLLLVSPRSLQYGCEYYFFCRCQFCTRCFHKRTSKSGLLYLVSPVFVLSRLHVIFPFLVTNKLNLFKF